MVMHRSLSILGSTMKLKPHGIRRSCTWVGRSRCRRSSARATGIELNHGNADRPGPADHLKWPPLTLDICGAEDLVAHHDMLEGGPHRSHVESSADAILARHRVARRCLGRTTEAPNAFLGEGGGERPVPRDSDESRRHSPSVDGPAANSASPGRAPPLAGTSRLSGSSPAGRCRARRPRWAASPAPGTR